MKFSKSGWLLAGVLAIVGQTLAAPHVTINSVAQRWPWNNRVDITYTVGGGQKVSKNVYYKLVFTAGINGQTYSVDGGALGASAADGTHTVTWYNPPAGIKATQLTLSAAICPAEVPSGDDYMIVDLASGAVTFEGLLATQEASNQRYNQPLYKGDKLVLRKVPAGGPYPTGWSGLSDDPNNKQNLNKPKMWTTDRDFYVAIFMCTQAQYVKLGLTNPSTFTEDDGKDLARYRPVNKVSWDTLRGQKYSAKLDLGEDAAGASFLKRLNARTKQASGITAFDLPGEVMFEIATRAGVSNTKYYWGDTPDDDFVYAFATKSWNTVGIQNGFSKARSYMVGSYQPNKWGFYDMSGLSWEWMRDDYSLGNLGDAAGPFAFAWDGTQTEARARGGAIYDANMTDNEFRASHRNKTAMNNSSRQHHGFRIAWIRQ